MARPDFYHLQVQKEKLKRDGYAVVYFEHLRDYDYYDLSAGFSRQQFESWLVKEFGYLKYSVTYH